MTYSRHIQTYRQTQAATVDSGTLLLMLYQGTIDFLQQAQESLTRNDMGEKGRYVMKALAVISELLVSLDFKAGGEVAQNLEQLYLFMLDQITVANVSNDPKPLTRVIELLKTLKEGWDGAVIEARKQGTVVAQRKQDASVSHEHSFAARA
jgi:flagellar secretion chaperone FliS